MNQISSMQNSQLNQQIQTSSLLKVVKQVAGMQGIQDTNDHESLLAQLLDTLQKKDQERERMRKRLTD